MRQALDPVYRWTLGSSTILQTANMEASCVDVPWAEAAGTSDSVRASAFWLHCTGWGLTAGTRPTGVKEHSYEENGSVVPFAAGQLFGGLPSGASRGAPLGLRGRQRTRCLGRSGESVCHLQAGPPPVADRYHSSEEIASWACPLFRLQANSAEDHQQRAQRAGELRSGQLLDCG